MIPLPLARMMVIGTRGIGTVAKGVAFVAPLAMMDDPMANKGAIAGCSVAGGSALSLVTKAAELKMMQYHDIRYFLLTARCFPEALGE
ncbi:hypothetical protein V6N13_004966 [Hibiscus sabdariffa]